jgi:hypothetical protein
LIVFLDYLIKNLYTIMSFSELNAAIAHPFLP